MLGIVESVVGVAGKVLDKFVEDKDLKRKLESELKSQIISLDLAQAQTNLEQAKHSSVFIAHKIYVPSGDIQVFIPPSPTRF